MAEQSSSPQTPVLDTSVAVKFYVREDLHEEALMVLSAAESGVVELIAPSTLQPEFFNALWWKHRRGELLLEEVREGWERLLADEPASLYAPEDLIPRAAEIVFASGVLVYDALFLGLAEDAGAVVITADGKLLNALKDTNYTGLAQPLTDVRSLLR